MRLLDTSISTIKADTNRWETSTIQWSISPITLYGKVISLVDNSGSARGTTTSKMGTVVMAEIGNLTGIITARCSDDGEVGVFGDDLEILPIRKHGSVFSDLARVDHVGGGIGGSTEHGIWMFWDQAIKERRFYDHVFVYSDMQAGHGGLYGFHGGIPKEDVWEKGFRDQPYIDVPSLIRKYRKAVNPNVMVYLVQIAGYTDTIIPEYYDRTFILGGWSEHVLHFAHQMSSLYRAAQP